MHPIVLSRRGLLAPQNTFIENVIRITSNQQCHFLLANAKIQDFPIIFCDPSFCQLTGYNRLDLLHEDAACTFMHGELTDQPTIVRLKMVLEGKLQETLEIQFYRKDETPIWLLICVTHIRNDQDLETLLLITFKDITAQKMVMDDDSSKMTSLSMLVRLARTVSRSMAKHPPFYPSGISPTTPIFSSSFDLQKIHGVHTLKPLQDVLFPTDQSVPRYCQEVPRTPANILLHHSSFKSIWDWIILILTFYTAVMVPYNAAFQGKTMDSVPILVIDSVVDIVFFIDIMLNFHMTFVGPGGEVVSDPAVIRINYLKSWFAIDLLSCLPYDAFNAFPDATENVSNLFNALKVVRLLRLGRVARKLDQYIEYGAAVLVLLIVMFALIAHWFACIWFTIGNYEASKGVQHSWLQRLGKEIEAAYILINETDEESMWIGGPSDAMSYYSALYYTLSCMTSVGFGNISPSSEYEKIFTICMMILGSLFYATIFGNVTTIFQQMYSTTGRYHEMLKSVKDFMKLHSVPKPLSERVFDYVISTWSIDKGIDSDKILNYCPADLKADICVHLNREVFSEHAVFQMASEGCLRALAVHFSVSHWAPGDMLFHQGESLDSLCFIVTGSLEVVQDEEIVAIITKGDVVGDQFWIESSVNQCMANVRALTYCDLHLIKSDRLMEVLRFYQQFAVIFEETLILTYNLRRRIVFRKFSDLAKEKELEERKKNEPPLELDDSHPVRKIISRFRKMSLSRPSFFDSYHMDPAKSFRDDQLLSTNNSSKGLFSRLKKAAYLRRTSTFAESQFLLESPSIVGSPSLPTPPNFTEIESLCETPESIKTLLDGKNLFRSSIELNTNDSSELQRLSPTLDDQNKETKLLESLHKDRAKTASKLTVPNIYCDGKDSLLDEINTMLKTKHATNVNPTYNDSENIIIRVPLKSRQTFISKAQTDRNKLKPEFGARDDLRPFSGNANNFEMRNEDEGKFLERLKQMKSDIQEEVKCLHQRMDNIDFQIDRIIKVVRSSFP